MPPALFEVECNNIASRWLGDRNSFRLEMSWNEETADKARRLRATLQSKSLVEMAAVALAFVLARQVLRLRQWDVTSYGDRADYRSVDAPCVLEISGTEAAGGFDRRHREKIAQAMKNPLGWDAYVVVCAFSSKGHRIRLSRHGRQE